MSRIKTRDVSPIIQNFRDFLLGRKHKTALRFQQDLAPRTADPPNLPEGPAHRLSENYYYARDARREVFPPLFLAGSTAQRITAGAETSTPVKIRKTPGEIYNWD